MDPVDSRYPAAYAQWQADPQAWWGEAAGAIDWTRRPERTFDPDSDIFGRWFPGGELNMSHNCLDRHVDAGRGEQTALIWDSAMTGQVRRFSYRELRDRTARVAGALAGLGALAWLAVPVRARWGRREENAARGDQGDGAAGAGATP